MAIEYISSRVRDGKVKSIDRFAMLQQLGGLNDQRHIKHWSLLRAPRLEMTSLYGDYMRELSTENWKLRGEDVRDIDCLEGR